MSCLQFGSLQIAMHVQDSSTKKETRQNTKVQINVFVEKKCDPLQWNPLTKKNFSAFLLVCLSLVPHPLFSVSIFLSTSLSLSHSRLISCLLWLVCPFQLLCSSLFSDCLLHLSSCVGFPQLLVADSLFFTLLWLTPMTLSYSFQQ